MPLRPWADIYRRMRNAEGIHQARRKRDVYEARLFRNSRYSSKTKRMERYALKPFRETIFIEVIPRRFLRWMFARNVLKSDCE
jgi:hypothetical protein